MRGARWDAFVQVRAMWDMSLNDNGVRAFFIERDASHLLLSVAAKPQCHLRLRQLATHVMPENKCENVLEVGSEVTMYSALGVFSKSAPTVVSGCSLK